MCPTRPEDIHIATDFKGKGSMIDVVELEDYVKRTVAGCDFKLNTPDAPTWTFILCNASHEQNAPMNHWVPAFSEEELGEELYQKTVETTDALDEKRLTVLEAECAAQRIQHQVLLNETSEESADDVAHSASNLALAEWQLNFEKRWQEFRDRCKQQHLHPVKVPAEGNCLLWSYLVLQDDDVMGQLMEEEKRTEMLNKIKHMRSALSLAWRGVRCDPKWQSLFETLFLGLKEQGASEVKTEPSTPQKVPFKAGKVHIDLCTPEKKADQPMSLKRVNACRKAAGFKTKSNESFTPVMPDAKKKCLESLQASKQPQEDPPMPPPPDPPGQDDDALSVDEQPEQLLPDQSDQPQRRRIGRRRPRSERDLHMKGLRIYLARAGVAYGEWMSWHWRQPFILLKFVYQLYSIFCF